MSRSGILIPILFGSIGTVVLIGLGIWQLQRMEWKQSVVQRIEARMAMDPLPLPPGADPDTLHLLRVQASGQLGIGEIHVLSSIKGIGPGFRVIAPFETGGRRILVDLGFVPDTQKDPADRGAPRDLSVTGFLYWPDEKDSFTPLPDKTRGIWFARDVPRMAATLGTEPAMIVAQSHDLGKWPRPRPPGVDVPDRHLEYALTWFGLAFVWAAMTLLWLRTRGRGKGTGG